jgi:hypothetical protein
MPARTGTKLVTTNSFWIVIAALLVGTNIPGQHDDLQGRSVCYSNLLIVLIPKYVNPLGDKKSVVGHEVCFENLKFIINPSTNMS